MLEKIPEKSWFVCKSAGEAYIAAVCRPDITFEYAQFFVDEAA